jgi:2'-5' RNA ligase
VSIPITALIVRVPEAEALVQTLRLRFDASARQEAPAHITLLVPFMAPQQVTADVLRAAGEAIASVRAFAFTLDEVCRWPQTVYLAPRPRDPFVALTATLASRFPAWPPYAGQHDQVIPHLTVAQAGGADADVAEGELRSRLRQAGPVHAICNEVTLLENSSGRWQTLHAWSLDRHDSPHGTH